LRWQKGELADTQAAEQLLKLLVARQA
jgi:hypothetical protein